jgi:hypothetical protein
MDNTLIYLFSAILAILFTGFRIKGLLAHKKRRQEFKTLTPEFFAKQRARMLMPDYIKWLRRLYTEFGAEALERKEKGMTIPEYLINGLRLTENEMEDIERQTGKSLLGGKKISEELQRH